MTAQEVLQTIKDRTCRYITGVDDDESDDNDNVVGPVDVMRTFDRAELTKDIRHNFKMFQQHDGSTCINAPGIHRGK